MKLYDCIRKFLRKMTKTVTFTSTTTMENAPFIVTNHTGISAPAMFLVHYPTRVRTWSHYAFLQPGTALTHLWKNVLPRRKGGFLLFPIVLLFLPVIVTFFRWANPIPVWRGSKKITQTLDESVRAKTNGTPQIVFPEKLNGDDVEQVNPYLFKLNRGFVYAGKYYYEKTGRLLRFYPAYSCPALKTVSVGEPILFNPNLPILEEKEIVCRYLEDKIRLLAESLPPHDPVLPIRR